MDNVSSNDLGLWKEALSSCAIEGNQYAIYMLKLYDKDKKKYLQELMKLQQMD